MTSIETPSGRTLDYEVPATGSGWTEGTIGATTVRVYIRPEANGGGVFIDHGNGELVKADTGEETIWFNNRLWTRAEEQEEMERIKETANGTDQGNSQ